MAKRVAQVGEGHRLVRLTAGDPNAVFETNEFDPVDFAEGGDGIVYADTVSEAQQVRDELAARQNTLERLRAELRALSPEDRAEFVRWARRAL